MQPSDDDQPRSCITFSQPFLLKYKPIRMLMTGGYSEVHLCLEKPPRDQETSALSEPWVVKVVKKRQMQLRGRKRSTSSDIKEMSLAEVALEIASLKKVQGHQGVVAFKEFIDTPKLCYMVFEHLAGPELFDKIERGSSYSEDMAADLVWMMCDAMKHVHEREIIHRDMKPENIVFRTPECKTIVVLDFGLAIPNKGRIPGKRLGTPNFMAPEMVGGKMSDEKLDVWGVGCMVFALLCGDLPFEDTQENYAVGNFEPLYQIILMGEFEFSQECWNRIDSSAQVMLEAMLTLDPYKRVSFEDVLRYDWFRLMCTEQINTRGFDEPKAAVFDPAASGRIRARRRSADLGQSMAGMIELSNQLKLIQPIGPESPKQSPSAEMETSSRNLHMSAGLSAEGSSTHGPSEGPSEGLESPDSNASPQMGPLAVRQGDLPKLKASRGSRW